jgi:hypothetical protein
MLPAGLMSSAADTDRTEMFLALVSTVILNSVGM